MLSIMPPALNTKQPWNLKFDQARKSQQPLATVVLIVGSWMKLDTVSRERLRRKFDNSFVMAKEGIPFMKYGPLNELEAQHEVDLGTSYNNDVSAKYFTHYIVESQQKAHKEFVEASVPYFSFLMDGTTDVN